MNVEIMIVGLSQVYVQVVITKEFLKVLNIMCVEKSSIKLRNSKLY